MYKGISSVDGHAYAIRRIDGLRIVHEAAMQITGFFSFLLLSFVVLLFYQSSFSIVLFSIFLVGS